MTEYEHHTEFVEVDESFVIPDNARDVEITRWDNTRATETKINPTHIIIHYITPVGE